MEEFFHIPIPPAFATVISVEKNPSHSLARHLATAQRLLVFTGAGISTASGISDFRGPHGVWQRRQPVYYQDFLASETARIEHWDYKLEAWPAFRAAQPNRAHAAIVQLEQAGKLLAVVTQNIDGLHGRAGTTPERLIELHGTNAWIECQSCGARTNPEAHFERFARTRQPPRCACGGWLKPATISFGQELRPADIARAEAAALGADCVIALGSTLSVYPAATIPLLSARRGMPYIVINQGPTEHDGRPEVTLRLEGDVTAIFPAAVEQALSDS